MSSRSSSQPLHGEPAAPRLQRAGTGRLVAGRLPRPRRAEGAAPGRTGRDHRDRPVRPDARRHAARRRRRGAAALHPVERRPQRHRVRRAGARLAGAAPGHRQHRHARLHRAQAAVGAQARAGDLRAHGQGAAAQGLRALAADRRVRRGHVRRVGHAVARRRRAPLVRSRARRLRHAPGPDAAPRRRQRAGRPAARPNWPRAGASAARRSSPAAPATTPPARWASARCTRATPSSRSGTSGVLWATTAHFAPNPARAVHAFCHAVPNTWHQMGVLLSAASSLAWWASVAGRQRGRAAGRDSMPTPGGASPVLVRALPVGRAHAAQRRRACAAASSAWPPTPRARR